MFGDPGLRLPRVDLSVLRPLVVPLLLPPCCPLTPLAPPQKRAPPYSPLGEGGAAEGPRGKLGVRVATLGELVRVCAAS
eukprot:940239-Pyramimonas_sp.AAC.1